MTVRKHGKSVIVQTTAVLLMVALWTNISCPAMTTTNAQREPSVEQMADKMDKLFQLLETTDRELPRDTFDLQGVVDEVGREPAKLFRWVRDETYLVPYRGELRGPMGVLMDRLGNSLDRALLLSALLRLTGQTVRLSHDTLSETEAKNVMLKARVPRKLSLATHQPTSQEINKLAEKYATQVHLDQAGVRKSLEESVSQSAEAARKIESFVQRSGQQPGSNANVVGDATTRNAPLNQWEAHRDHWWVEMQEAGSWLDLDPTLPDAEVGKALGTGKEPVELDKLEASLHHSIQVRVLIERWEDGRLRQIPVLSETLQPSELIGTTITLRHAPVKWPKDLNLFAENDPSQRLRAVAQEQHEWIPMLIVGDKRVAHSSFTDSGDINETPGTNPVAGAFNTFGSILSGATGENKKKFLTAEWTEYTFRSPGRPDRVIRREIFDLIGSSARSAGTLTEPQFSDSKKLDRSLALLGETEILPTVCSLSPWFVRHLSNRRMLDNREAILNLIRKSDFSKPQTVNDQLRQLKPTSGVLYVLTLVRQVLHGSKDSGYIDSPNVLTYFTRIEQNTNGELAVRHSLNITSNEVAFKTKANAGPFSARLRQHASQIGSQKLVVSGRTMGWSRIDTRPKAANVIMALSGGQAMTEILEMIFIGWPFLVFTPLGFFGCAGRHPDQNSDTKNYACLLCGLLAGFCIEAAWLAKIDIGLLLPECGFWAGAVGGGPCAFASFGID
jgi:hypothetical protein